MAKRSAPVEIPGLDVAKAKRYSRTRLAVLLAGTGWSVARMTWFALGGRSARLRRAMDGVVPDRRLAGPAYLVAASALSSGSSLPIAYFGGHRVERRFGLTKQSDAGWLADQAKGLALGLVLQVPLSAGAFAVIRRRPRDWWLILSGATVPLLVLVTNLAPVLIAPLFNRFEPLSDRDLADRVRALADKAGVPIADVFRMDMSRQTEKPNAFFTGLGNTKRIVLADTLIDRFAPKEVDGVVAHELGHQVHGDIWRLIALGSGMGLGGAWAVSRLAPPLVRWTAPRTGVTELGDEASLPLLSLVGVLTGFVAAPIQAAIGRTIERRTDRYALELTGDGKAYAATMEKLATLSLADPDPPAPVVFFLYGHPPIAERIATARAFVPAAGAEGALR
ncbi:MAG: M48 family metallopeptidase [Chloroflexota bacterium]|nr:M48 family metallopeptidase [Chloroflexota bacterium]